MRKEVLEDLEKDKENVDQVSDKSLIKADYDSDGLRHKF
jgi:hypothetical protein